MKANRGRERYRAWRAEERAEMIGAGPRPRKLEPDSVLSKAVEEKLMENWSPENREEAP